MWAGYCRVSRVGDREHLISPDLQAERIREYAAGRGIEVALLDAELDVSGDKLERPVLSEAIAGIEDGRFAGIIVAQLDRLSRNITDALQIIKRIEAAGGQVIAVAENFDAGTPEGRMARNVILALGEMQLDRYKSQFAIAKQRAVEHGIWPNPKVPLGYRKGTDRRLVPDQPARIRRGFEARAAGKSWAEVAEVMGVPYSTAPKILTRRTYLGEIVLGEFVNRSAHEPIVSRDLWEAAQMRHPKPARGVNAPSLLLGLVRCAGCRGKMSVSSNGRHFFYACRGVRKAGGRCAERAYISRGRADRVVQDVVLAHLDTVRAQATEKTRTLEQASASLGQAEAELVAYQELTRVSDIGPETFMAGLKKRIAEVEHARRVLTSSRVAIPITRDLVWDDLPIEAKRHLLRGFLGCVFVKRGGGIRVIAAGYEPDLPRPGDAVRGVDWPDGDLPGELGAHLS